MLAVKSGNEIRAHDLPQRSFFVDGSSVIEDLELDIEKPSAGLDAQEVFILKTIQKKPGIGRKQISENSYAAGFKMTENQVRSKMNKLKNKGYIVIKKRSFRNGAF